MRIYPENLSKLLEKKVAGFYFCSGQETFLVNELADKIIYSAKQQGFTEWSRIYADSSNTWEQAYSIVHTPSLFSPKIALVIQLSSWKLDDQAKNFLTESTKHDYDDVIVIVKGPKIERAMTTTKWFQTMTEHANWIDLPTIYANQLPEWLQQRARQYGLKLSRDHALEIAQRTENNLPAAAQAIEKLELLNTPITSAVINDIVDINAEYDVFKFIDACLAQESERAYHIFTNLKNAQTEPIMMIGAFARELRIIRDLFFANTNNIPLKTAAQRLGVWESRLPLLQNFMRKHTVVDCQKLLAQLAICDAIAKGAIPGNIWHELFDFWTKIIT